MFWSKIWFFLVAAVAITGLTIAILLTRASGREVAKEDRNRLAVACGGIGILLKDDARSRVEFAGLFGRAEPIVNALADASAAAALDEARMKTVRGVGASLIEGDTQGERKPDFVILVDKKGRVVARVRLDEDAFRDVVAGRPLVDDALAGYLRDDLWVLNGTMYLMSAAPAIKDGEYVGAVVLGYKVTNELAQTLRGSLPVDLGFYLGADTVAASKTIAFDQSAMQKTVGGMSGGDFKLDCQANAPLQLRAGTEEHLAVVARLPGEAARHKAYYAVFVPQPDDRSFFGSLDRITKEDFSGFPWVLIGGLFLVVLGGGIGLMLLEADRPLRRLSADAVRLAKGEVERLAEDAHPGKFGSIARSVNIHIDKLGRDAKSAKKDLDQLLGPPAEGSLGTIDLLATALPSVRPGGPAPAAAPPPSEFKFGDSGAQPARPAPGLSVPPAPAPPPPVVRAPPPPAVLAPPPPPVQAAAAPAPLSLDDDILGDPEAEGGARASNEGAYFKQVYDQFIALKKSCNEQTSGLTFEKFSEKLVRNRDDLMAKTGCREVRFTVYVKEGKAALKASPVKDDA